MLIPLQISQNYKKWYHVEERKNIMYLAIGWGGVILSIVIYAYFDSTILATISFFIGAAGFIIDHKESNK